MNWVRTQFIYDSRQFQALDALRQSRLTELRPLDAVDRWWRTARQETADGWYVERAGLLIGR